MSEAVYFVRSKGRITGPFAVDMLQKLVRRGTISRVDEVSSDRVSWARAAEYEELFPGSQVTAPLPPPMSLVNQELNYSTYDEIQTLSGLGNLIPVQAVHNTYEGDARGTLKTMAANQKKTKKVWMVVGLVVVVVVMVPVVGALAILAGILIPTIGAAREQANRQACAANLAGIAKSMCIYANENYDAFPTVVTRSLRQVGAEVRGGDTGMAEAETAARSFYTPENRRATQCLWLLVVLGQAQPQQFVCRSDSASASLKTTSTSSQNWASDFAGSANLSYSMASPWSDGTTSGNPGSMPRAPWWKNNADSGQPILADGIKSGGKFDAAADICPSHKGSGSNVSFGDGHAEWTPITKSGINYSLNVPAGTTAPDTSGIFATGASFPTGTYTAPSAISTTKLNGVYDMIFTPALTGR